MSTAIQNLITRRPNFTNCTFKCPRSESCYICYRLWYLFGVISQNETYRKERTDYPVCKLENISVPWMSVVPNLGSRALRALNRHIYQLLIWSMLHLSGFCYKCEKKNQVSQFYNKTKFFEICSNSWFKLFANHRQTGSGCFCLNIGYANWDSFKVLTSMKSWCHDWNQLCPNFYEKRLYTVSG